MLRALEKIRKRARPDESTENAAAVPGYVQLSPGPTTRPARHSPSGTGVGVAVGVGVGIAVGVAVAVAVGVGATESPAVSTSQVPSRCDFATKL
ncbi:MAG: hypothetical protein F4X26_03330 [Chloroflexi bacterium]|nr:hypothetical protein [Chloroflexota bacterium]MYD65019.1 hypothetical protein [Chloroflexota bacterium]